MDSKLYVLIKVADGFDFHAVIDEAMCLISKTLLGLVGEGQKSCNGLSQ